MCVDTGFGVLVVHRKRRVLLAVSVLAAALFSSGCGMAGFAMTKRVGVEDAANSPAVEKAEVTKDAMQRFNFSKSAMAKSAWKVAEEGLLTLVDDYPELSGPALNLALVYRQTQDNRQAKYWFEQSITRNRNNLLAYNQYGIFLREQGQFEQAEETYRQALSISEVDADAHLNLGILYDLYRGEKKGALQHLIRYQELQLVDDPVVAGWIADLKRQLTSVAVAE